MYNSKRFKFGAITLQASARPSVVAVRDAIAGLADGAHESADPSVQRESADAVVLNPNHDDYSYCHFEYRAVFEASKILPYKQESSRAQPWHVCSRAFYFENGQFAVQPTRGVSDRWLPALIGRITDSHVGESFRFYGTTDTRDTTNTQQTHTSPGKTVREVTATDSPVSGSASSAVVNNPDTIRSDGDPADLLDETAHRIRAVDDVSSSGTVVATWDETNWPNNVDETRRANAIYEQILPYLQNHN